MSSVLAYCAQHGEASITSVRFLLLAIIEELKCRIATNLQDITKRALAGKSSPYMPLKL